MAFEAPWPIPAVLLLSPQSGLGQHVISEELAIDPPVAIRDARDSYGNLAKRVVFPTGRTTVVSSAVVDTADEIDVDVTVPRADISEVPDWVIEFTLPSRYCESDTLGSWAMEITSGLMPGYPQVDAIRVWIHDHLRYEYGTSAPTTSARETLASGAGVCRDFAHLGIALCRALQIPARMVVGYLHELDPMDQHAWFEAYLGDRWFTFDATQDEPKGNRVTIAYGRDAADVAFVTQFGPLELTEMGVRVDGVGAGDTVDK